MANLPLPKTGAALVAAMAGVSDVIKSKGVHLEHPEDISRATRTPACIELDWIQACSQCRSSSFGKGSTIEVLCLSNVNSHIYAWEPVCLCSRAGFERCTAR